MRQGHALRTLAITAAAAAAAMLTAGPALAGPADGATPRSTDVAGAGSDTTPSRSGQLLDDYSKAHAAAPAGANPVAVASPGQAANDCLPQLAISGPTAEQIFFNSADRKNRSPILQWAVSGGNPAGKFDWKITGLPEGVPHPVLGPTLSVVGGDFPGPPPGTSQPYTLKITAGQEGATSAAFPPVQVTVSAQAAGLNVSGPTAAQVIGGTPGPIFEWTVSTMPPAKGKYKWAPNPIPPNGIPNKTDQIQDRDWDVAGTSTQTWPLPVQGDEAWVSEITVSQGAGKNPPTGKITSTVTFENPPAGRPMAVRRAAAGSLPGNQASAQRRDPADPAPGVARAGWTVIPGGCVSVSGSGQVKDKKTGTIAKCTSIKMGATLKSGSGNPGTGLGTITSGSFSGCTIATITVNVAVNGLPWSLNAVSYNSTTGVTSGTISGIILVATAPGCSATLEGPTAGTPGTVKVSYTNSTGKLKLLGSGGNLTAQNVSGCLGLVNNGDAQAASGSLTVTPKQTITSP